MKFIKIILIFLSIHSFGQNIEIKGHAPDYKGEELTIYKNYDFITKDRIVIKKIIVDSNGDYAFKFSCKKTEKIYIDAGYFNLYLYIYPNQKANILIPKYRKVPKGDIFFKQIELPAIVDTEDTTELNSLILAFDKRLTILNNKYYNSILDNDKKIINTIKSDLDNKFKSTNNYFRTYKKYKLGLCEYPAYMNEIKKFINIYFSSEVVMHDAYYELLNITFPSLITYNQFKKEKGFNYVRLLKYQKETLCYYGVKNKELTQLIILKSLHDGAFKPLLKKDIYIDAIKEIHRRAVNINIKNLAKKILDKVTYLSKGYTCPIIEGLNSKGEKINTREYKGKYIYYMFFERFSRMIEEEMDIVARIADSKDYLKVLVLCDENNRKKNISILKKYKLDNNALFIKNFSKLKHKFKVVVSPSYFLVDKKGDIIQAHTIKPNPKLYRTLNNIHIKELKEGNIKETKYFK